MHQSHNISYETYAKLFTDRANRYNSQVPTNVHKRYEEDNENIQKNINFLTVQFFLAISKFSESFTQKINSAGSYTIEDFNFNANNILIELVTEYNCYSESIDYTPIENLTCHDADNNNMEDMIYIVILSKNPKLINTFLTYIKKKYPNFNIATYLQSHRYFHYGIGGIIDHLTNLIHVYLFINIWYTETTKPMCTMEKHKDTHNHKRPKQSKNIFEEPSFYQCDKFASRDQNIVSDYVINLLHVSSTYKCADNSEYIYGSFNKKNKLSLNVIINIEHNVLKQIAKEIFEIIYITLAMLNIENTFDIIRDIIKEFI